MKAVLAKSLRTTLEFIKLKNQIIQLPLVVDEIANIELKRSNDIEKLMTKSKVIKKLIVLLKNKLKRKVNIKKLLNSGKNFVKNLGRQLYFKSLPLNELIKSKIKVSSKKYLNSIASLQKEKNVSQKHKKKLQNLAKIIEDFVNQIILISEIKLSLKISEESKVEILEKVQLIREMEVDIESVLYLIDIDLIFKEKSQKKKTEIIVKINEKLQELEHLHDKVGANFQSMFKELIHSLNEFMTRVDKNSDNEDVKHLVEITKIFEKTKTLTGIDKNKIHFMRVLIDICIKLRSNSKENKRLLSKALIDMKELNWIEEKFPDKSEEKKIVGALSEEIEQVFNNYKFEIENEISVNSVIKSFEDKKLILSEDDSVNEKLKQLLPTCFELFMQLKFQSWDNEVLNPDTFGSVLVMMEKMILENAGADKKLDIYRTLFKFQLNSTSLKLSSKNEETSLMIGKISSIQQRCLSCNLISVLTYINAKKTIDDEIKEKRHSQLGEISHNLEKLLGDPKNSSEKYVFELTIIIDNLLQSMKEGFTVSHLRESETKLIELFEEVLEDGQLSVELQVTFEDTIRKIMKIMNHNFVTDNESFSVFLEKSEGLMIDLSEFMNTNLKIFSDASEPLLTNIFSAFKTIKVFLQRETDILTDEEVATLKENCMFVKSNIDMIINHDKPTKSVSKVMTKLANLMKDLIDDLDKENLSRTSELMEDLVTELLDGYDGLDVKTADKVFNFQKDLTSFITKINEFGFSNLEDGEIKMSTDTQKQFNIILENMFEDKKLSDTERQLLQRLRLLLQKLSEYIKNESIAKSVSNRNDLLDEITMEPKENLDKEGQLAIETILESLPSFNKIVQDVIENGIDSLNSEDLNKLTDFQNSIAFSLKVLDEKKISPQMSKILEKISKNIFHDKDLIVKKKTKEENKEKEKVVAGIMKNIIEHDPIIADKLNDTITTILKIQGKISAEGLESLTSEERETLSEKQQKLHQIVKNLRNSTNTTSLLQEDLEELSIVIEDVANSIDIENKMDDLKHLINDYKSVIKNFKTFDNLNRTISNLLINITTIMDQLITINIQGLDTIEPLMAYDLEIKAKLILSEILQIESKITPVLATKSMLKEIEKLTRKTLTFFKQIIPVADERKFYKIQSMKQKEFTNDIKVQSHFSF